MSQMLKCPNPSCPYVFDPSQVPVGVVLSCPRCGMQFTLGPPPANPQPGAPPDYPPGYPAGPPQEPVDPEFEAVTRTAIEDRDEELPLPPRGTNKAQVFILAGIAAVLMAGTALAIIFMIKGRRVEEPQPDDPVVRYDDLNFSADPPPTGWTRDDNIRAPLGSPYIMSYKRENPEAYVAIGAKKAEKGRAPRLSEMRHDMETPLTKLFLRLANEDSLRPEPPLTDQWLGLPISAEPPYHNGYKFRARSADGLQWAGEVYSVAKDGVAYYWIGWSKESDFEALKAEFADFRAKFKLLTPRKKWEETNPNVIDFKGDTVSYTISDAEGIWTEVPTPDLKQLKEFEPDLDKRLRASLTPRGNRKARPEEAELSVYLLGGGGADATETARKFAKDMETNRIKQANPDFAPPTFTELGENEPPQGDPTPSSVQRYTNAVRLLSNIAESKSANQLIVVSGIKVADKTVVVMCTCRLERRDTFETKFIQIASSLR